jgi:hypothetical protein
MIFDSTRSTLRGLLFLVVGFIVLASPSWISRKSDTQIKNDLRAEITTLPMDNGVTCYTTYQGRALSCVKSCDVR